MTTLTDNRMSSPDDHVSARPHGPSVTRCDWPGRFVIATCLVWSLISVATFAAPTQAQEKPQVPSERSNREGFLVEVELPIIGDRDEVVRKQIESIVDANSNASPRPIVVLRFAASPLAELGGEPDNGGMKTRGSQFERCLSLARFLTGSTAARVRLVAYLPETVEGHAVLPILACEEILCSPTAELGRAAIDEAVDATVEGAYKDIVSRRATLPEAVVLAMLSNEVEVYELSLADGSVKTTDRNETEKLRGEGKILSEDNVWPGGALATFSGQQLRSRRWIARTVADSSQVVPALGLSNSLRTSKQLPREWTAVTVRIDGPLLSTRVNQIIRGLNEEIDRAGTNLAIFEFDNVDADFQQSSRLANYIADLQNNEVYTLGLVQESLRGPLGLAAVACRETCLIGESDLGPSSTTLTDIDDDTNQRFLIELASSSERPAALMSALLSSQVRVQEYINQQNGRKAIYADWQVGRQVDAQQWVAKQAVAGGVPIPPETALQYRLVDSIDETNGLALSRLGLEELPDTLKSPWIDGTIEMLLAQGWLPRLLLTIGFFALMAELGNPGLGAGGFLAGLCFLGFFWIEGLNGNVEALEVILFVAGLLALAVEIFVVPGFGLFGIGGLLMLFVSVVLASQTFVWPTTSAQLSEIASNMFWTACLALGGMVGLLVMHKQLERLPMFRWISILPDEDPDELDHRERVAHRDHLVGQSGLTTTRLNPSGKAQFGNEIVPVVGSGDMIDRGVPVHVVEVRGNLVLVEPS